MGVSPPPLLSADLRRRGGGAENCVVEASARTLEKRETTGSHYCNPVHTASGAKFDDCGDDNGCLDRLR